MEPRMQKNQLSHEESIALLDRIGVGVLSMVDPDGLPYAVPVNYVRIGDAIYTHGRRTGTRVVCMENDPRCCLVVYDMKGIEEHGDNPCDEDTAFESVIVRGRMHAVEDFEEKDAALRAMTAKLVPSRAGMPLPPERVERTGVFRLDVEEMTGKFHRARPGSTVHPAK